MGMAKPLAEVLEEWEPAQDTCWNARETPITVAGANSPSCVFSPRFLPPLEVSPLPLRQTQRSPEGPRRLHRIPRLSEAPWEVP